MKNIIVINGDFYDKSITGVQRYATEVINELDKIYDKNEIEIELIIPKDLKNKPSLKNIPVVQYGKNRKLLWQQFSLMNYCRKKSAYCLCLCTHVPYFYTGHSINVVHDAATLAHPEFYSKKYLLMAKILQWEKIKKLKRIITVSEFSKNEISKYCGIEPEKIIVAPNSWDHMRKIHEEDIFNDYQSITKDSYVFTLSSLSANKNLKWILEVAKNNKNLQFVVAGKNIKISAQSKNYDIPDNVIFTGYISDEQAKSLMKRCKAFLFPTFYEGFGIPPMEALSVGSFIIVSDTPCMHEVYGDSAMYIDPNRYDYDIFELLKNEIREKDKKRVLEKYSWKNTAEIFYNEFLKI